MDSKLKDGMIPAHTECPFERTCPISRTNRGHCKHEGENHPTEFSCASARGFDILHRDEDFKSHANL